MDQQTQAANQANQANQILLLELMKSEFANIKASINTLSENTANQLGALNETMTEHINKDEKYWQKIDAAEGQIGLIKWFGGTALGGVILDGIRRLPSDALCGRSREGDGGRATRYPVEHR
jgi:hypothetical protein